MAENEVIPGNEDIMQDPNEATPDVDPNAAPVEGNGEQVEGQEQAPQAEELPTYVKEMQERLEKAEKALEARAGAQVETSPQGDGRLTPEQVQTMQKDFGFSTMKDENGKDVTVMDKEQFTKGLVQFGRDILRMAREHADGAVHGSTSEIRTDAIISDLSLKTPDIRRFAPQIKQYLKERYSPKDHSDPKFIMDGYWRAKGMSGNSSAPVTDRSKVRVISPAPANRGGGKVNTGKPLSPLQRSMIGSQFKDEAELRNWDKADLNRL